LITADEDDWTEVARYSRRSDAEGGALVLVAIGITSRLVQRENRTAVFVTGDDALRAQYELTEYDRENIRRSEPALPSLWAGLDGALAYSALLIVLYVAAGREMFGLDWTEAGYAGGSIVFGGEWWRAFTALTLHADLGHLASNVFAGSILGMLLAQALGQGLSWLAILLAGAIGNALNASVEPVAHASIGASTAIFGALGLLAALMWRRQTARWARGLRTWLPLAAGVMLLAFLGFGGEQTDFGAHIAGFFVGIAGGVGLSLIIERVPRGRVAQGVYALTALILIGASWLAAFAAL